MKQQLREKSTKGLNLVIRNKNYLEMTSQVTENMKLIHTNI